MVKKDVKVAIVGLGRVGGAFITKLFEYEGKGITIAAAAEKDFDAPGVTAARSRGIAVYDSEEKITAMGEDIDVIFDLTGSTVVERNMRLAMLQAGNTHTAIVPRIVAVLIWNMLAEGALPEHSRR